MTTVDLVHRGKSTIDHVELFDECEFGADRPHIRGCFGTLWEVAYQIAFALNDEGAMEAIREKYADEIKKAYYYDFDNEIETHTPKEFGAGNPMEVGAISGIAMNRYDVPEKKEWENSYKSVNYPHHADYFVQFIIRPKFYADHALITLGIRWNDGKIDWYKDGGLKVSDLEVIQTQLISPIDASIILKEIKKECNYELPVGLERVESVLFPGNVYAESTHAVKDTVRPLYKVDLTVYDVENQTLAGTGALHYPNVAPDYNKNTCLYINEDGFLRGVLGNIGASGAYEFNDVSPRGRHVWGIGYDETQIASLRFDDINVISHHAGGVFLRNDDTHKWLICAYKDYYKEYSSVRRTPVICYLKARFHGGKVTHIEDGTNKVIVDCNWVPCYDTENHVYVIYDTIKKEKLQLLGDGVLQA